MHRAKTLKIHLHQHLIMYTNTNSLEICIKNNSEYTNTSLSNGVAFAIDSSDCLHQLDIQISAKYSVNNSEGKYRS